MASSVTQVYTDCPAVAAPPPPPPGHLPPAFNDSVHATRCLAQLRSKDKPIEQYIYLSQLKHANEELFYQLCLANLSVRDI
jgi:malate dehydrogenase (oxaloacetate-decarboxylating)(NADP+)